VFFKEFFHRFEMSFHRNKRNSQIIYLFYSYFYYIIIANITGVNKESKLSVSMLASWWGQKHVGFVGTEYPVCHGHSHTVFTRQKEDCQFSGTILTGVN
jgi:hypothetical protein